MTITLRDYQSKAVWHAMRVKPGVPTLFVGPTGAGKTVIIAEITRMHLNRGNRVLIVSARGPIVRQTFDHVIRVGVPKHLVGEWMMMNATAVGGKERVRPDAPVQVAGVLTLLSRGVQKVQVVIIDEAQHATTDVYKAILKANPNAIVYGFTATPYRMDGTGMDECFDHMHVIAQVEQLISDGYLVEPHVWAAPKNAAELRRVLKGVRTTGGDYARDALGKAMRDKVLMGNIIEHWFKLNPKRWPTVVFASNVEHSKAITARFRRAGVKVDHIDASTSENVRRKILHRLHIGELQVVCNYGVLGEGWDQPSVKCLILARPTKSKSVYVQQTGRVLRPYKNRRPIILDHAGCCLRKGWELPGQNEEYSLAGVVLAVGEDGAPLIKKRCPQCGFIMASGLMKCPECSHVFVIDKTRREIVAELQLIERLRWEKWDHILGTMSDAKAAEKIGCTKSTARNRRNKLDIPSHTKQVDWLKHDHLLGTMTDSDAAEKIGCTKTTACHRRIKLDILSYASQQQVDWLKHDHLLGTMTDSDAAEKIGCTRQIVASRRNKLDIPTHRSQL